MPYTPNAPAQVYLPGMSNASNLVIRWTARSACSGLIPTVDLEIDGDVLTLPNTYHCPNYYYLSGLAPGTSKTFRVRAQNAIGFSNWSTYETYRTSTTAPGQPTR